MKKKQNETMLGFYGHSMHLQQHNICAFFFLILDRRILYASFHLGDVIGLKGTLDTAINFMIHFIPSSEHVGKLICSLWALIIQARCLELWMLSL